MFSQFTKRSTQAVQARRVKIIGIFSHCIGGSSERLISRVQIRSKRASKDFEYLNIFRFFSAMDTRWTLKLGQGKVNLSVWPSPEFKRD